MTSQHRSDLSPARLATLAVLGAAASATLAQTCNTDDVFPASPANVPGPDSFYSASADLDGDGDLDILASASNGQELHVFINDGVGGFTVQDSGATEVTDCNFLELGDMDGDGELDAVVVLQISGARVARWYRGLGDGSFEPTPRVGTTAQTFRLIVTDYDADGDLDLVAAESNSLIRLYTNDGSGGFGASTDYPYSFVFFSAAAAELNSDGYPDLIFGGGASGPQDLTVVLSNGSGQLLPPRFYDEDPTINSLAKGLTFADYDGDGDTDIAYSVYPLSPNTPYPAGMWVRFNNGAGEFSHPTIYAGDHEEILSRDFDGDGDIDLASLYQIPGAGDTENFVLRRNDGSGDFSDRSIPRPLIPGGSSGQLLTNAGDFDGNGSLDLVFPSFTSGLLIAYNACTHPPVIAEQPESVVAEAGSGAAFSVGLAGNTPVSYQWRKNGQALVDGDGIDGVHSPTLTLGSVVPGDVGLYECVLSNSFGTRVSQSAVLAVLDGDAPDCPADLALPFGELNFFDVAEFLNLYNTACP